MHGGLLLATLAPLFGVQQLEHEHIFEQVNFCLSSGLSNVVIPTCPYLGSSECIPGFALSLCMVTFWVSR